MRGLNRRSRRAPALETPADLENRLRSDLEQRGVDPSVCRAVAQRIAPRAAELSSDAYPAFIDGVAAAEGEPRREAGAAEIQRLVQDFAIELKKLDEGLRQLSSYLLRIRDRTGQPPRGRVIH